MDPWLLHQVRLAERRGILTGKNLNEVQVFALELLMYQERVDSTKEIRQIAESYVDGDEGDAEEDLSAVQWQSPSDTGAEEVMGEIEMFNQAMANNSQTVTHDGGEWV